MITTTKFYKIFLLWVLVCLISVFSVCADEAQDVTKSVAFECENIILSKITDDNIATHSSGSDVKISCTAERELEGIYIKYNDSTASGGLLNGKEIAKDGFLHEYVSLDGAKSFVLEYSYADICDIQVFSSGTLPHSVQVWETGEPDTDILLCATHSDDDQLFFAGLLPYYAVHKGANVRVAYFINHYDTYNRTHELLDGLWHCGVKNYPDISPFPDGYSESAAGAEQFLNGKGFEYEDFLNFQKNLIHKYKPLVAVLHDVNGEYGHGAHMLNTKTFLEACERATDGEFVPEKIYIHLYSENKIKLDIDKPLDEFNGLSAFNISQQAFGYHKSQHWTWFYKWIYGSDNNRSKSTQISTYNPADYGLYHSSIGEDTNKNDLLENVKTYSARKQELEELKNRQKAFFDMITGISRKVSSKNIYSELTAAKGNNTASSITIVCAVSATVISAYVIYRILKRKG